jgi:transposase-like protein
MKCPKCESYNTVQYDSNLRFNRYMCKDCDAQWEKTNTSGYILSAAGALTLIGAIFGGDWGRKS